MGIIKYSGIVSEIKGTLGGAVFQRMGQTLGVRSQVAKRCTVSAVSNSWRTKFSSIATSWQQLNDSEKATWVLYAPAYPAVDRFGNVITLTAYQLFIQTNNALHLINAATMANASPFRVLPSADFFIAACILADEFFNITIDPVTSEYLNYLVYVSDPYPAQSIDRNPKLRYITYVGCSSHTVYNMFSDYQQMVLNKMVAGTKIFYEVWALSDVDGVQKKVYQGSTSINAV